MGVALTPHAATPDEVLRATPLVTPAPHPNVPAARRKSGSDTHGCVCMWLIGVCYCKPGALPGASAKTHPSWAHAPFKPNCFPNTRPLPNTPSRGWPPGQLRQVCKESP
jgi:hypothetical protein